MRVKLEIIGANVISSLHLVACNFHINLFQMIFTYKKNAVYFLEFRDCPGIYIGKAGRKMITSVSE